MLSYYYGENTVPSNIDDFAVLNLLCINDEQEKILSIIKNNRLTRKNVFTEYYPIDREFEDLLTDLFLDTTFEKYKSHFFVLVLYRVDKGHFETCKEKVECDILKENQFPLARKRAQFVDENDILRVHYYIKREIGDAPMDIDGNLIKNK